MASASGDGSFWDNADQPRIRQAHRYALTVQRTGPGNLDAVAGLLGIDIEYAELASSLGAIVADRTSGRIWGIGLHERMNARDSNTIGWHEVGHALMPLPESGKAYCKPKDGRDQLEDHANANGALLAVPFEAIEHADLFCANADEIARTYNVSTPYVYIRNALAILLGEKPGDRDGARAALDLALCAHEGWACRVAAQIEAENPPIVR